MTREQRVLVVSPNAPDFDKGSGAQRTFDFIEFLQDSGWHVSFAAAGWCLHNVPHHVHLDERYAGILQQRGIQTYAGLTRRSRTLISDLHFDLAVIAYFHVAEVWMPIIRKLSPTTPIIVDSLDLNFMRSARQIFLQRENIGSVGLLDGGYASRLLRELNVYSASDMVLAVSDKETNLINDLTAEPHLTRTVPDGENYRPSSVPFSARRGMFFVGDFFHAPNVDAMSYLCSMILPQLDPELAVLHPMYIAGGGMSQARLGFNPDSSNLRLLGWVPDTRPYYENVRIGVMPLLYGAGTKRKVIQALMAGTPSVVTSIAAEGLGLQDGEHALIADDPVTFAHCITSLLEDEDLWTHLSKRGQEYMRNIRGRGLAKSAFEASVDEVLRRTPKSGDRAKHLANYTIPGERPLAYEIRMAVRDTIPRTATVVVISRGDDGFLNYDGRTAWHFPQGEGNTWLGDGALTADGAVSHLEELRARGAEYLIVPGTSFRWLESYPAFKEHLEKSFAVKTKRDQYTIFALMEPPRPKRRPIIDGRVLERLGVSTLDSSTVRQPVDVDSRVVSPDVSLVPPVVDGREALASLRLVSGLNILFIGNDVDNASSEKAGLVESLAKVNGFQITQRWIGDAGESAANGTKMSTISRPKFERVNEALHRENLETYDYVVVVDADAVVPEDFVQYFLSLQHQLRFVIAQPSRSATSYIDVPIAQQQRGVIARQTLYVQPNPVVSFHRSIYHLVFPFDMTSPEGVGYECVWAHQMYRAGHKMGIVDAVPVSVKPPRPHVMVDSKLTGLRRTALLRQREHYPLETCMQIIDIAGWNEIGTWGR